jgi:hypothetical protein
MSLNTQQLLIKTLETTGTLSSKLTMDAQLSKNVRFWSKDATNLTPMVI